MSRTFETVKLGDELYYYPQDKTLKVTMINGAVITCEMPRKDGRKDIIKFNYDGVLLGQKKPTLFWSKPKIEIPKSVEEVLEEGLKKLKVTALMHNVGDGRMVCFNGEAYYMVMLNYPLIGAIKFRDEKELGALVKFLNKQKVKQETFTRIFKKVFFGEGKKGECHEGE